MRPTFRSLTAPALLTMLLCSDGIAAREAVLPRPQTQIPRGAATTDQTLVFTQNLAEARILFVDPVQRTRVVDFLASDALKRECSYPDGSPACFLIGGHHSVINDHDYVEFAATRLQNNFGIVARVPLSDPKKPVWRLMSLDFSDVESNGACTQSCASPGLPSLGCSLQWVHEFVITDEDPAQKWVEIILADMMNYRVEKVRLDYRNQNSCGKVLWVVDSSNPGWPPDHAQPNTVQEIDAPEGKFLLVTLLSENATSAPGVGRILLFDLASPTPTRIWEYPAPSSDQLPNLNVPHMGIIQTNPADGKMYLLYGHSLGMSNQWNGGDGGALGIAAVDDIFQTPRYMGDWILPSMYNPLNFPRELEQLSDGSYLATDAGCYFISDPSKSCPGQIYWLSPSSLPSTTLPGYFNPEHTNMNVVTLPDTSVTRELSCGFQALFDADLITSAEMGSELRAAAAAGGTACPAD